MKIKHYFRYADDFIILHPSRSYLQKQLKSISGFLFQELFLFLHPNKIQTRKLSQGLDFLGYVILPHYLVLRTKTKRRMFKKLAEKRERLRAGLISQESFNQSLQSYLGILKHCQGYGLELNIKNNFN